MSFWTILDTVFLGPLKLAFEIIFMVANDFVKHPGLAIIILSLAMNILVLPLYRRADAMQEAARDIENKIAKGAAHIKKTFSGDERMMILQTYYRQNNYKPTSALNGSVSLLLEIPFFMAAYQFLSHAEILNGVSLGPIKDLGAPDAMFSIGGFAINVLPILMTLVNVISSALYLKGFPLKTKIQLYAMAGFFLVFLYTSPAGLVFYWTLNNVFSLVKTIFYKLKNPKKVLCILTAVIGAVFIALGAGVYHADSVKKRVFLIALGLVCELPLLIRWLAPRIPSRPQKAEVKPNRLYFLLGSLLLTVLTGVLIPSNYIAAEPQEYISLSYFHHPINYVLMASLLAAGTFIVWMSVFYWLASPKGKVLFERIMWVLSIVMLVNYMFFDIDLGYISSELKYDNKMLFTAGDQLINILVVVAVAAVVYFLATKIPRVTSVAVLAIAVALSGMSALNISTITSAITEQTDGSYKQGDIAFNLSKDGKNVVVLMLDRSVGNMMPYIFNEKPELKEKFDGFTYYSNTLAYSPATRFSTPALYGGYEYTPVEMNKRDDTLLVDKHNEALKVLPTLFEQNGFTSSVGNAPFANYQWTPDTTVFENTDVNAFTTAVMFSNDIESQKQVIQNNYRNFFCFSIMKSMPLSIQPAIYNNGQYRRMASVQENTGVQISTDLSHAEGVNWRTQSNYEMLLGMSEMTGITDDDTNTFLTMTLDVTHAPGLLNAEDGYVPSQTVDNTAYDEANKDRFTLPDGSTLNLTTVEQMEHYHVNMMAMLQLGNWFDYLREQGVYDNTRIILVSDHSWGLGLWDNTSTNKLQQVESYGALLMVKDFDADGFTTSDDFMTIADVPTLATDNLIENPKNPFTGNPINSSEKTAHEQLVLMSWDDFDTSGTTFHPWYWGSVKNNVLDRDNWSFALDEKTILKEHKLPQ